MNTFDLDIKIKREDRIRYLISDLNSVLDLYYEPAVDNETVSADE